MPSSSDTDHGTLEFPRLRVTREVPMWGILSLLAALGCQAVALYYSQQSMAAEQSRQSKTLEEIKSETKILAAEMRRNDAKTIELTFQHAGLEQRVRLLEAQSAQTRR